MVGTGTPGPQTEPSARGATEWRATLADPALTILAATIAVLIALGTPLVPPPRFGVAFFAMSACVLVIVVLRLARGLPLAARVLGAALATLVAALGTVAHLGFGPGLTIGLGLMGAMLAIALGRAVAVLYFVVAAAALLVLGRMAVEGRLPLRVVAQDPRVFVNWVRWVGVFTICGIALVLVLHTVVRRVEQAARAQLADDEEHQRASAALLDLARDPAIESGEAEAAFAAITEAGARGLDMARAGIWLFDDDGRALRCVDVYSRGDRSHASGTAIAAADHPSYFAALTEGRAFAADDARADPRTRELTASYLVPSGVTSMLDAPIRFRDRLAGVICLEHVGPARVWSTEARRLAAALADFAARALAAAERDQREVELRTAYDLLGRVHRRLESAKEEERRHIARELHDELGQTLTALKLRLQMAMKTSATGDGVLGDSVAMVDRLIGRARRMSIDLSPPLLDEAGLAPAIRAHVEGTAALSGMRVELDTAGLDERLPAEVETAAFRVVQESLTNVIRHAEARRVDISVHRDADRLRLRVHDDGRGFDVAEARRAAVRGEHFGVAGMTERVKGLGGTLVVESRPGQGTAVSASLPVAPPI